MATADLSRVQFWQPPLNPLLHKQRTALLYKHSRSASITSSRSQPASLHNKADPTFKRTDQPMSAVLTTQGHDFATQPEGDGVKAEGIAGRTYDPTKRDDEADDNLPSLEETLGPLLQKEISRVECQNSEKALQRLEPSPNTNGSYLGLTQLRLNNNTGESQGTRDSLVILEDDESDTPDPEAAAVSTLVNVGADSTFKLSKPIDPSSHDLWYDVEDKRYVDEDLCPIPLLELDGLASTSTSAPNQPYSRHRSPRSSQDQINQRCKDRTVPSASDEPAPHSLPTSLGEDGGGRDENVSELEKDMLLAFEEQEKSLTATSPSSPRPPYCSTEPSHPQADWEHDQGGASRGRLEELGYDCPLRNQDQDEEELQEQQRQEVAGDAMKEAEDDGEPERRRRQDGMEEVSSDTHHFEGSDCSHNIHSEDDEGDEGEEEPRPAKRRKLLSQPTHKALTPFGHNPKARLRQPHSDMPHLAMQLEVNDTQPQADLGNLPALVDDEQHHTPRPSRSPSAPTESVPIAEYQEWPFQGFLKCIKIGDDITYNLEFKLPPISEHLKLPINPKALDICSGREALSKSPIPHETAAYSKIRQAPFQPQKKRVRWTPEEDATLLQMRNDGCSWEDIHAALPHRSIGTIHVRYSTKLKE